MRTWTPLHMHTERDVHGYSWEYYLTSDDIHPDMVGAYGLTIFTARTVLVWAGQPTREMHDTVLHETAHVHLYTRTGRICEQAISVVVPSLMDTIRRQGWQMPTLPHGWRSLAAHARHVRYGKAQKEPE